MPNAYERYYKAQHEDALIYQDFIVDVLYRVGIVVNQYASRAYQHGIGESRNGIEIKYDKKFARTGNVWIEVAEKSHPQNAAYVPAGIYAHEQTWLYVIGNYDVVFLFPKQYLRILHTLQRYRLQENTTRTSQGFLLPEAACHTYALMVLKPDASARIVILKQQVEITARQALELHALARQDMPGQFSLFAAQPQEHPSP